MAITYSLTAALVEIDKLKVHVGEVLKAEARLDESVKYECRNAST